MRNRLPDHAKLVWPHSAQFNPGGQAGLGELAKVREIHLGTGVNTLIPLVQQEYGGGCLGARCVRSKNTLAIAGMFGGNGANTVLCPVEQSRAQPVSAPLWSHPTQMQ